MNSEEKLFIPHGVQGIAMDGLRAKMATVQGHSQDIDFNTRASCAVTRAHVLSRDNLREEMKIKVTEDEREAKTTPAPLRLAVSFTKKHKGHSGTDEVNDY